MARKFGKIDTGFWQNPRIRSLSDDAQKLLLYLFSNKHTNGASAYELPMGYLTEDLSWPGDRVGAAFHELSLKPHILRDARTNIVFVPGWWDHNQPENPKVAVFLTRQLLALPDCRLKMQAIEGLKASGYRHAAVVDTLGDWRYEEKQETLQLALPPSPMLALEPPRSDTPVPAAGDKPKGTRLQKDWMPPAEYRDYAIKLGLSDQRIDAEAVKFVRHFTGPDCKRPVKKDWLGTWQNWVDGVPKSNGNGTHTNGHSGEDTRMYSNGLGDARWPLRVQAFHTNGVWMSSWGPEPGKPGCKVPPELLAPAP